MRVIPREGWSDNNMRLLPHIIVLLVPSTLSIFRLPSWLYNPISLVTNLPSTFLNRENPVSRDLDSCQSTITAENQIFSSPEKFLSGSCQSKIQIDPKICNLRVKFTDFDLEEERRGKCEGDEFYISTNRDDQRKNDRASQTSICGARPGTEIHIPVSQLRTVYLNVRLASYRASTSSWSMKVEQERCEDNLVRKFGLLDSVDRCRNRRKSRQNAKETFRRMKKQLFSRRRSARGKRSVFDWLFKFTESKESPKDNVKNVEDVKKVENTRRAGSSGQNTFHKVSGIKNTSGVPSDFFVVASSSSMELSKYSSQSSGPKEAQSSKVKKRLPGDKKN